MAEKPKGLLSGEAMKLMRGVRDSYEAQLSPAARLEVLRMMKEPEPDYCEHCGQELPDDG